MPSPRERSDPGGNDRSAVLDRLSVALASGFYLSFVPSALLRRLRPSWRGLTGAGLVGTAWGAVFYACVPSVLTESPVAILLGLFFAVVVSGRAEAVLNVHDDSRIVIDEWIGMWIAAVGLPHTFGLPLLIAFVAFRVFDVVKGPWGHALQRLPGGWGVTMDDVFAGVLANLVSRGILSILFWAVLRGWPVPH